MPAFYAWSATYKSSRRKNTGIGGAAAVQMKTYQMTEDVMRRTVKKPLIIFHMRTNETTIEGRCNEIKVFRQWTCEKIMKMKKLHKPP